MENKQNMDTKNPFELAIMLGKCLKDDPRLVRMNEARKAYESDEALSTLMAEYQVQQKAMENVTAGESFDPHMIQLIQDRINELYEQITQSQLYRELEEAQNAVNELMNAINNTITFAITGEMPSSCTHDCSTCGGGCH